MKKKGKSKKVECRELGYSHLKNEKKIKIILFFFVFFHFSSLYAGHNQKIFTQDSLKALKLNVKGIELARLGDYEGAINYFKQVYEIKKKLHGERSPQLSPPLINLGIIYKNSRSLDKAIESYKMAESLYIGSYGEFYPNLGLVYTNMGSAYILTGDYTKALEYQQYAGIIFKKDSVKYNDQLRILRYNMTETKLKLGQNREAIVFAERNIKSTLPRLKPRLYDLIATAYQNLKIMDLADKNYMQSIASWKDLYGDDHVELATEFIVYASFLIKQKKYEQAISFSEKARSIVLKYLGEKSTAYSEIQSIFGDYFYERNIKTQVIDDFRNQRKSNLMLAIQYYQNAIISVVDSFNIKDPMVNPPITNVISEIHLIDALKKKAHAMNKLGDIYLSEFDQKNAVKYFSSSLNSFDNAAELIHKLRTGYETEESKSFLAQNQESTFIDGIRVSYKLFGQTKDQKFVSIAFGFSERNKASNLLAAITNLKAKQFGGIPDSLLKREEYIKVNMANYTTMLFEENHLEKPDTQRVNLYTGKIFRLKKEYDKIVSHFEKFYPSYYQFKYENRIVELKDVQEQIRNRDVVVQFVIDEPDSESPVGEMYRFVISKNGVDFSKENIDNKYEENIDFLHGFLTNPNYLLTRKKDFVNYSLAAFSLYNKLLAPVSKIISGKDVTIIPDDKLSYIPFDALLSSMPDTTRMNFSNLDYLVKHYSINYSYSSTLLFGFPDISSQGKNNVLAFSPEYVPTQARVARESHRTYYFSPLPGALDELGKISEYIKNDSYIGPLAQKDTFVKKSPEYGILHLAMHTIINDSLPMYSKLVFSNATNSDDGFLNTYEIYNLKLNARMAVLSACETGSGKMQRGEGVMSLARGFFYAGCPSIVMTLWQVEDKSGARMMEDFYYYLSKGKRKDVALRLAKLKHIEASDPLMSHPHFWLGYVSIGNPEPLFPLNRLYFVLFLLIALLALIADRIYRKRTFRKLKAGK